MLRTFLVATTLVSLGASPVLAGPDLVGGVALGPQHLGTEIASISFDADGYHLRGFLSGAYDFTPVLGLQGDVLLRHDALDNGTVDSTITSLDGALHLYHRNPDAYLLGGLVQLGRDEFDVDGSSATVDRGVIGAEGQVFFGQFTAYGQAGLQRLDPANGTMGADGWFVTAEIRYFLTEDLKLEAHAGRSELDFDTGTPLVLQTDTLNLGAGIEYRFADLPFSIFGQYDYAASSVALYGLDIDSHRVVAGLRFGMGAETLQDRDRHGASLKPVDSNAPSVFGSIAIP